MTGGLEEDAKRAPKDAGGPDAGETPALRDSGGLTGPSGLVGRIGVGRLELAGLLAVLALAAVLRLPGLDARGAWDADQGHDMLVLQALVTRGDIPLLGPQTSIGTFHHGAVYYYLLAPAAFLSGADPTAVTTEIALFGIGAVGAVWWLARRLGGPLAAALAGLLAAVSPSGIDESTFIWNPNLIPFAAGIALAATLQAWDTRRPRWWLLAALGAMVTMQCHVLGVVALPPLVAVYLADVRRRRAAGDALGPLLRAGAGAVAIILAGYLPLAVYELTHDFAETRAILAYVDGGGGAAATALAWRIVLVAVRSITWPLAGLVTDHVAGALVAALAVVGLGAMTLATGRRAQRWAAGWLLTTLAWSVVLLAEFAPSLATVTPGLPNDHYHAFLDPLVLAIAGTGLARLAVATGITGAPRTAWEKWAVRLPDPRRIGPAVAVVVGAILVVTAATAWPPAVSPDGGWLQADQAAAQTIDAVGGRAFALDGIPPFKSADALRFPLEHRGVVPLSADALAGADPPPAAVLVCDPLFDEVVGLACGGAAEADWQARVAPGLQLSDRIDAGSRRVISIYLARPPG